MEITPGTTELLKLAALQRELIDDWGEITVKELAESVWKKNVMHTHDLYESIDYKLIADTIHILYSYYGMYQDMGVSRGISLSQVKRGNHERKRKVWYSKTIYREVARLAELVAEQTDQRSSAVVGHISDTTKNPTARIALQM